MHRATCPYIAGVVPWCSAEYLARMTCLAGEPATSFSCIGDDLVPHDGICGAERQAFNDCWLHAPSGVPAGADEDCDAVCAAQAGLICASPSCVADCKAQLQNGVACRGAWAFLLECWDNKPFVCNGNTPEPDDGGTCDWRESVYSNCLGGVTPP